MPLFLAIIFLATVVRAPIQPWLGDWFHWDIALRTRRDHSQAVVRKILTLPLGFYDENNPGRIVEVGNHAELLAHGGLYHRWHVLQETGELLA